jgi:alpha-beta hydrolase superfamily lysophospholipase
MRRFLSTFGRITLLLTFGVLAFVAGAATTYNQIAPSGPPLQLWHTEKLTAEFTADKADQIRSFEDYRRLEDKLFAELDQKVFERVGTGPAYELVRYSSGSAVDPRRRKPNWNRSFELSVGEPKGGVLLLHGRSDGPYSLRALGQALNRHGYWVIGLRQPGHGTIPSGLLTATWEDAAAAVQLSMAHLASKVGKSPVHIIGFSTGAALAGDYALGALDGTNAPVPASLIMVSPAIAINPKAALAEWKAWLALLPGLERLAWAEITPEFDPFNYNSFTINSIAQVHRLTRHLATRIDAKSKSGQMEAFPPTLVFLSSVDATVSVDAVIDNLLEHVTTGDHELILFDINRKIAKSSFLISDPAPLITRLMADENLPFALTVVTNESPESTAVVARRKPPSSTIGSTESLELSWPANVFSLSHVALQFPPDDPLYGRRQPDNKDVLFPGQLALQGELGLLLFSSNRLLRLRHNPFYKFVETRVLEWVDNIGARTAPAGAEGDNGD